MRVLKNLIFFLISIFSVSQSHAQEYMYNGVDITKLVKHLQSSVTSLKQPVTVYNWSTAGAYGDSSSLGIAEQGAKTFWNSFGYDAANNMYGRGLYAANDPIVSSSFGGFSDKWLLLEMKLPVGFVLVDLLNEKNTVTITGDLQDTLSLFSCPNNSKLDDFFISGGQKLSPTCQKLVKHIFSEIFKIDGFAYGYSESSFKACSSSQSFMGYRAFVITDSKWMSPELITYYNSKSTHHIEKRIMIQSLFYSQLDNDDSVKKQVLLAIGDYLTEHPNSEIAKYKNRCEGDDCTITVTFCEEQKCQDVALPKIPRPEGPMITAKSAAKIPVKISNLKSLIWDDLEGKPKAANVNEWLLTNKFGCSGKLPY